VPHHVGLLVGRHVGCTTGSVGPLVGWLVG
jgi:hypothetical protein